MSPESPYAAETGPGTREERLAFLLRLNDALRPLSDPAEVQQTAARLLAEEIGSSRVGYAEVDGRDYIVRHEHANPGSTPLVGSLAGIRLGDALGNAFRRGETVVVHNVHTDPRLADDNRQTLLSRDIAAFIGVTLFKNGRMVAAFGANNSTPRTWTPAEAEIVRDVAERTWDAVERTRAESTLRRQEERLRLAIEASAGGSWTRIGMTDEVDWDQRFRTLYGFTADEPATADGWLRRVHQDDRPHVLALFDELSTTTTTNSWQHTFRIVRPDGNVAWVQSRGRAERDADGRLVRLIGLDLDFTQHRHAEEALQARRDAEHERLAALAVQKHAVELEYRTTQLSRMASELILAEQRAREQIARTLHDGLQQLLVIAAVNVEQLLKPERDPALTNELLVETKQSLDDAIATARSLSVELYPPVLQRSGLPAALTWLANWIHDKYKVDVQVVVDAQADSPRKDVRSLLFESVRELLFNAVKHAHADRVTVRLTLQHDDQLCITVSDEGAGFDPAALDDRSSAGQVGWGLFSIRERVMLLGGGMDIHSAPGRGTRVRLVAPRRDQEGAGSQVVY